MPKDSVESLLRTTSAKRFVIEDSITKVTSDGEPHEMMTIVAGLSGLLAAVVILAVLVSLVGCKKSKSRQRCKSCRANASPSQCSCPSPDTVNLRCNRDSLAERQRFSISTCSTKSSTSVGRIGEATPTVAVISSGQLEGNLNAAFVGICEELTLTGSLTKKKKRTHWKDELEECAEVPKDTAIQIDRY